MNPKYKEKIRPNITAPKDRVQESRTNFCTEKPIILNKLPRFHHAYRVKKTQNENPVKALIPCEKLPAKGL